MTTVSIESLFGIEETEKVPATAADRASRPRNPVAGMSGVGAVTLSDYLRERRRGGQKRLSCEPQGE